jgi:hypothetical protein
MRVALAAAVLVALAGDAGAQPRRDVVIESDPPGADVYLNSKDDGSVCKTPCTIKAPVGDQVVIIEIENHVSLVESLVVPRRGKPAVARFKLARAVGTLVVRGPEGAVIRVGDVEKGKAPARLEIAAGPHTITLTLNGKQVLQDLIEIDPNQEVVVRGREVAAADPAEREPEIIDAVEPAGPRGTNAIGVTGGTAPRPSRGKYVAISGVVDVGFRFFRYENPIEDGDPDTPNLLPDEREGGQVIAGPMIELWPGTLAGVRVLRGLALVGRIQFPINKQPVAGGGIAGTMTTFWQSLEVSARHRWTFSKGTIEVGAGFVRDQHQFNTNNMNDLAFVPDADYRVVRIGVRGSLLVGGLEPYLAAENRIVLTGGPRIEDRFSLGATAGGWRAVLGASFGLGPIQARLEGAATRYTWTFKYDTGDAYKADGATDSILAISAGLGYAY